MIFARGLFLAVVCTVLTLQANAVELLERYQTPSSTLAHFSWQPDGFVDGNPEHEVVFGFNTMNFDVYDDGSARLYGSLSLVDFDNQGHAGPYASDWTMDLAMHETSNDGTYQYYQLNSHGVLINDNEVDNYAHTFYDGPDYRVLYDGDRLMLQFNIVSWMNWIHYWGNDIFTSSGSEYQDMTWTMDRVPQVPEPATLALVGLGLGSMALMRRRKGELHETE